VIIYVSALTGSQRLFNKLCGFSETPAPKLTKEQEAEFRKSLTTIEEDPYWSKICDYNAVLAIGVTCFIIGFYA